MSIYLLILNILKRIIAEQLYMNFFELQLQGNVVLMNAIFNIAFSSLCNSVMNPFVTRRRNHPLQMDFRTIFACSIFMTCHMVWKNSVNTMFGPSIFPLAITFKIARSSSFIMSFAWFCFSCSNILSLNFLKENTFDHPTSNILSLTCIHFGLKLIFHFFRISQFTLKYPSFHMDFFTNNMFRDIYRVFFLSIFITKNITNNYNFYYLITIIIARIVVSVKCEVFKLSKMNHLTMFLPFIDFQFPYLC